jgi:hypothetical protein
MTTTIVAMVFTAYIVDCVRTAGGKRNGALSGWHAADLGAQVATLTTCSCDVFKPSKNTAITRT